jgi:hypothetical protein
MKSGVPGPTAHPYQDSDASKGRFASLLWLAYASRELGLQFRIEPRGPRRLAEQVNSEGGFAHVFKAVKASAPDVFGHLGSFAGRDGSQEEQFVAFV